MEDFDVKSMIFGGIIALVIGSGLYAFYLKMLTPIAFSQTQAYGLIIECTSLRNTQYINKIDTFFVKVEKDLKKINKSDISITVLTLTAGINLEGLSGMGQPLLMCMKDLSSRAISLKDEQDAELGIVN